MALGVSFALGGVPAIVYPTLRTIVLDNDVRFDGVCPPRTSAMDALAAINDAFSPRE